MVTKNDATSWWFLLLQYDDNCCRSLWPRRRILRGQTRLQCPVADYTQCVFKLNISRCPRAQLRAHARINVSTGVRAADLGAAGLLSRNCLLVELAECSIRRSAWTTDHSEDFQYEQSHNRKTITVDGHQHTMQKKKPVSMKSLFRCKS